MKDNISTLYGALKNKGYTDIGKDETEFRNWLNQEGNVKALYGALSQQGFDDIGDEQQFTDWVGVKKQSKSEDDAVFEANEERFRNGQPTERVTTQSMIDTHPELGLGEQTVQKPSVKEQYILDNRPDMFGKRNASLMDVPLGNAAESPELSGDKLQERIDVAQRNLQDKEYQKGRTKAQLRRLNKDVSDALGELQERVEVSQIDRFRPANLQSMPVNPVNQELMPEYTALRKAQRLAEESENIINEAGKKGNTNFMAGLARGFWDNLNAEDYTFGADDAAQSAYLYQALDKADRGEQLTKAEETLLDAAVINMATQAYFAQDLGKGYGAGSVTAESIPFMLEMAINPISASGKTSAKMLLKYGLKKFANNKAAKVGARLLGDALAATGMAATTGAGDVLEGTTDRLSKNYDYGVDADGNLYANKKADAMGMGEALARSFTTRAIENQSEMIFNAFKGVGGMMKGVNDVLPGGVNKFFDMLKNNKAADAYRWLKKSPVFRNYLVKDVRNATQIGGIFEEYAEEVYNNLANFAIGEMSWDDVVSLDNNIDTFLGLAPTQVMFGLLGLGGAGAMRYQTRRTLEDLQATMNEQQRKQLEGLLDMGMDAEEVDVRGFIRNVMQNKNYTIDNKRDMIKAAFYVAKQKGIDQLTEADVIDKVYAENSLIDSVTDPSTGLYSEIVAKFPDAKEGIIEVPGNVVGWIGEGDKRQPVFVAEGMDNTEENRRVLKPGEWDASSVQEMPAEQVKTVNEEMIREEAAVQAERESKYAPEVMNYVPQLQDQVTDANGQVLTVAGVTPDGVTYLDEQGLVNQMPLDSWRDLMQAQFDAQEAEQKQAEEAAANTQAVVDNMPRKTDETGRIFIPKSVQGDEVAYDITDAQGNVLEQGTSKVSQFAQMQDYVAPVEEQLNDDGTSVSASGESVGEQVNTEVNNPEASGENVSSVEVTQQPKVEAQQEPTLESVVAALPKTKKGEIDYEAMTPQQQYQYTSLSESPEVALEDLQADIAANEEELVKMQDELGKARGGKRAELRDKVKKLASANEELKAFYESVAPKQEPIAETENTESADPIKYAAEEVAEEPKPIVAETENPKKARKPKLTGRKKSQKPSEFTDEELRPANGVELAAEQLAAGNIKITVDSYKKETGYGEEERKKLGLTPFRSKEKGGISIERAAEKLVEEDNATHNGRIFNGDTMAARDAIIELFSMSEKWSDVTNYIQNNRMAERQKREEAEYAEYENYIMQTFHMSVADYESAKEYDEQNNPFEDIDMEGKDAIFAEEYLKYEQYLNSINNDEGRTDETPERSDSVLSQERVGNIGGNQRNESQGIAESVGSEPLYNSEASQESTSGSEVAPSIEETNVGRMADIEARILEIEGRRNEISDELSETPDYDTLAIAELRAEEWELEQEQADLEAEYSGLRAMNDESNAISEAEGSGLRFRESAKEEENRRKPLRERAKMWSDKLGVKVRIMESLGDVVNPYARRAIASGQVVTGWFEESTGEVCIYMPHINSESEVDATYIHEVVAHKGLRGLLGEKFDSFCDEVWDIMSDADRLKFMSYPGVSHLEGKAKSRAAADEYIAHLAENIDVTESAWSKFAELVKKFLKALGLEPKMTNADIANIIKKSYQRLLSGENAEGNVSGEGTRFNAKRLSDRRQDKNRVNNTVDQAVAFVMGKDVKEVKAERIEREQKRKEDAAEIYQSVLSGDFNDVTLQKINDYIDDATPLHPYGRRISQRLPQKLERSLHEGSRTNAVDALFSRICESSVPASRRTSEAGRREIEERKKEALKGWAIATNNWHTDLSEFTDEQTPFAKGTDSEVFLSKDGKYVIKTSFGKPEGKRFRPDIDNIPLFNHVFRNSAYEIVGYGEFDGKFARILKQPFVEFAEDSKVSVDERVDYMHTLGFEPINEAKTAFSNGTIIVADLQKSNIVKTAKGNIRVIDADVKLHTKDVGGNYTYPPVEADLPEGTRFRVVKDKNGNKSLVGLHNISEEKLRKAIKQGGLANPSMAVIDLDKQSHVDYGDITLIAPADLIDKKTGRNVGTYIADAYTPIYPTVVKKISDKGAKAFTKALDSVDETFRSKVRTYFNSYLDSGTTYDALRYWYLSDTGKNPPILEAALPEDFTREEINKVDSINHGADSFFELSDEEKQKALILYAEKFYGGIGAYNKYLADYADRMQNVIKDETKPLMVRKRIQSNVDEIEKYGYEYDYVAGYYNRAKLLASRQSKPSEVETFRNAYNEVKNNGLEEDFNNWLASKEVELGVEEMLFAGYDNQGRAKYKPNTLENASKLMKKEGRAGATGLGGFNYFVAILASVAKDAKGINKKKKNLSTQEEYDKFAEKWSEYYHDLALQLQPGADKWADYGYHRLHEIAPMANPRDYVKKEYGIELSDEFMEDLNKVKKAIKEDFPARYFETKFERPVYLNEFAAAVVPQGTSKDVVDALTDAGIPVEEYEKDNNEARMAAVDKVSSETDGVRFRRVYHGSGASFDRFDHSFMSSGEGNQAYGWGTYLTDVRDIGKGYAKRMGYEPVFSYKGLSQEATFRNYPELQYISFLMDSGLSAEEAIEKRISKLEGVVNSKDSYWLRKQSAQESLDFYKGVNASDIEFIKNRHLYDVEIPGNDGTNYLEWDKPLSEENKKRIKDAVLNSQMYKDYAAKYGEDVSLERLNSWMNAFDAGRVYRLLENFVDNDDSKESAKAISMLLSDAGYVGFEYPANFMSGGNENGEKNYVIFNEDDLKIVEHTRFRLSDKGRKSQNEVDKFTEKYNSVPVDVIESGMTDKELVDAFDNKFGIDDIRNFMKTSKTMGGYIRGLNKVIIFADRMKPERMEESLFHENIHALMYNENHTKLLAWFYEFAKDDEAFAKWREISENKEYELYERPEEFFAYVVSNGMVSDDLEGVLKHLDGEMQNELKELLNKIGYDYDVRRRSIGQSDNGRTDEGTSEESVVSGDARKTAREQSERLGNLFGQVADMGLDGVLGNKEYTRLMVDIYKELPEDVRTSLADDALRHYGGSIAPAVSDYVNKKGKANLWDKIAGFVREALRKVGMDVNLNANDAKYILWRSRKPLDRNNLLDAAEDIDMRYRLKVGEFEDSLTRFRSIEEVNDDYNRRLDELDNDRNQKDRVLRLGKPGRFLNDGGVSGSEIEMEFDKFVRKSNDNYVNDHPFSAGDIKNLPKAINAPIAVFDSTNHKDKVILTELKKGDNNFIVVIKATQRRRKGGVVLEVNEISTLYPKNAKGIVKWINDGLITNVDKRKALDWLEALHTHRGTGLINQELDSATKIVESFENPKIEGENVRKNGGGTRFRVDVGNKLNIRDEYEATIKKGSYQAREAVQDNMLSLRRVQELIEKASGKKLRDFENAWMHENRLSSVVQSAIHEMERKYYKPMAEAVKKLMAAANLEQEQVADYLMLKHGIERNREMAVRKALTDSEGKIDRQKLEQWYQDKRNVRNRQATPHLDTWRKQQEELDYIALMYGADMSRDYSGLTSMFDTDDLADCTERAYNEVEALEDANPAETEALRKAIKAMTQNTLDESFSSGLMNKTVYEELSNDMYDYYIPLRGFEETTSDEVYAYMDNDRGAFNAPLVRAKGRSSKSDNPLAYLKSIAESGIMQGERNKMKQTFLNMVTNHPSDLVSVREGVWAIFNPATGEWEAASFPESLVPRNATPADVDAAYQQWEADMEQRAQQDPNVKKISEAADVPYRVIGNRMNQHQVIVKRLGKSYTLTINGNPRLAMALNGLTNPNNTSNDGKVSAYVQQKVDALNRNLSAWYTTRNPDFVASNFMRDTFYTNTIVRAKEGNNYANHFHAHYAKLLMPGRMINLFSKYENGTLDLSKPMERDFHEFMMNGGETGYSNLKDLEHIKKQISKELNDSNWDELVTNIGLKGLRRDKVEALVNKMDVLNRAVENTARFAAYRTSRQQGRSVARSIFDAKEISVNFNKKGAGGTFFGATGQTWFGNLAAMVGAGGRAMYVFFNAAIQGTTNLLHVMKVNPSGTGAGLAAMFLMGALLPMLLGGDDEKDYYDLPDHVRRNHLILPGTGDSWISIPLPIEYRIMYGMGELLTSWRTGHERGSNIGMKMLSLTGQALPLNFLEEGVDAFMPSALSPLWQVYNNRSWTGLPIYKDNEFNKDNPEYTKAYKNVNRGLYKFTKALYRWTFDEENQEAGIDLNPAVIEHIAKGYFGGLVTTLDNVWKTGEMIAGEREFDWRNIPVGNRIFKTGDERTKDKRIQNEYFENVDKLEFMQSRERLLRKTKDGAGVPEVDKLEADEDYKILIGSDVYKKYVTDPNSFKAKKKKADKLYRQRKEKGDSENLERDYYKALEEANKAVR